jgi:hypothetical protein
VHAFNRLNDATIPAQTPIPQKDMILGAMQGSALFSTLDLMDGFYQILMRESDNYLYKYTRNYAEIVQPLTKLLRTENDYIWTDEQQSAFDSVKASLQSAHILALPDFLRPFISFVTLASLLLVVLLCSTTMKVVSE